MILRTRELPDSKLGNFAKSYEYKNKSNKHGLN